MLALDESPKAEALIEKVLLSWLQLYPSFSNFTQLVDAAQPSLLLQLLEGLPNFKLLKPVLEEDNIVNLAAKISTTKNIVQSLLKYHQKVLMRDLSNQLSINYVEFCMGSKHEFIKLLTLIISASSGSPAFQQKMNKLEGENAEMMGVMIENTLMIGHKCDSSPRQRLSSQKKTVARMEELELRVQQLESANKKLAEALKIGRQSETALEKSNKALKEKLEMLATRNEELEQINEHAESQLQMSEIEETATKQKLQIIKRNLEEQVSCLREEVDRLKTQLRGMQTLKAKVKTISEINEQIQEQNMELRKLLENAESRREQIKKKEKETRQELIKTKEHCAHLEVLLEESRAQPMQEARNQVLTRSGFDEWGSESNKYRVKDSLSFLNNESFSNNASFIHNGSPLDNLSSRYSIKTITEKSMEEESVILDDMKQNKSIFINSEFLPPKNAISTPKQPAADMAYSNQQEHALMVNVILELQEGIKLRDQELMKCSRQLGDSGLMSESKMKKFKQKIGHFFIKSIE